ncbi:hypothetical protein ACWDSL_06635 [Streptomyces sp. NPDC000941]
MTPLERLLAEELPTGTFGGARPRPEHRPPTWTPTPAPVAEEHCRVLLAALGGWEFGEHDRHLRVVSTPDTTRETAVDHEPHAAVAEGAC